MACTLAIMIGAATSANAMLLPAPGGSDSAGSGPGVGAVQRVVDQVTVTTVPWHLLVLTVAASVLLAVAFVATFTAVHTRHAAHPRQA